MSKNHLLSNLQTQTRRAKNQVSAWLKKFQGVITRWPLVSFFGLLTLLVALVVLGNYLRQPKAEVESEVLAPKNVAVYSLGQAPTITVQAKVEKSGVISIIAQTGGIVSKINAKDGQAVRAGQSLVSLSSNYQGGNAPSLTRQLSQKNYQHVVDTFSTQQEIIQKNRDLAEKANVNSEELRAIGRAAEADTRSLIDLNSEVVKGFDAQIAYLETQSPSPSNDYAITQAKLGKAQVLSGISGLRSSLRASEYTNSEDQELAGIADVTKENTLKQLELQEKALTLNKEIAQLNLRLAQVGESLMYPATPCTGTVERIHVSVGQAVAPGTVIATIKANQSTNTVEALVAGPIADQISRLAPSILTIDQKPLSLLPTHIASEPTDGVLHSVTFTLPSDVTVADGSYLTVTLPLGAGLSSESFIPLDAIYFSQTGAYVYVVDHQQTPAVARVKQLKLGPVYGQMVEVESGLTSDDQVILDRTVVETDPVQPQVSVTQS